MDYSKPCPSYEENGKDVSEPYELLCPGSEAKSKDASPLLNEELALNGWSPDETRALRTSPFCRPQFGLYQGFPLSWTVSSVTAALRPTRLQAPTTLR